MSTLTVDIPPELAYRLQPYTDHLPEILELGLQQFQTEDAPSSDDQLYAELEMVVRFLQASPSPEEIIAIRPSKVLQERIRFLLNKNRAEGLTEAEEQWWHRFEEVQHLVRMAKAKALYQIQLT